MKKTEQILDILRAELRAGHYKAGTKFPSERKLMMRFDAARTTINKITMQLAAEGFIERHVQGAGTRVLDPSPFPSGFLAYLGPVAHPYYARLINGIQQMAYLNDHAVSFFCPGQDQVLSCLEKIRRSRFQGLLAANIGIVPESFPIPVVYLDNAYRDDPRIRVSVSCTNYQGAFEMAETVLAYGHREILIGTSLHDSSPSRGDRIRGFTDALTRHGIPRPENRVFRISSTGSCSARLLLRSALQKYPGTTVFLCDSDNVALQLYEELQLRPPRRPVALTGFGNLAHEGDSLELPGVEQHPEEIGAQGVGELLRMIADPEYAPERLIEIETELVNLEKLPRPPR